MKKVLFFSVVSGILIAASLPTMLVGQQTEAVESAEAGGAGEDQANENQRLPPGYTDIITNSQRRRIYEIQKSYEAQINELQAQIAAIESKRDAEIETVLDDQQKQIVKFILQIRERNREELSKAQQAAEAQAPNAETTESN